MKNISNVIDWEEQDTHHIPDLECNSYYLECNSQYLECDWGVLAKFKFLPNSVVFISFTHVEDKCIE